MDISLAVGHFPSGWTFHQHLDISLAIFAFYKVHKLKSHIILLVSLKRAEYKKLVYTLQMYTYILHPTKNPRREALQTCAVLSLLFSLFFFLSPTASKRTAATDLHYTSLILSLPLSPSLPRTTSYARKPQPLHVGLMYNDILIPYSEYRTIMTVHIRRVNARLIYNA